MAVIFTACKKNETVIQEPLQETVSLNLTENKDLFLKIIKDVKVRDNSSKSSSISLVEDADSQVSNIFKKQVKDPTEGLAAFNNVVQKISMYEIIKKKKAINNSIKLVDPNNTSPTEAINGIENIFDLTQQYYSPSTAYHLNNAGEMLADNALIVLNNSSQTQVPTSSQLIEELQTSYYNGLTTLETQVNNDLGMTQAEKQAILGAFLLVKTTVTSAEFKNIIINLINTEGLNTSSSQGMSTQSLGSFFAKVGAVIAGAAIIVATVAVSAVLGNAIFPGLGMFTGFGGFYVGFEWAHDLFPAVFPDPYDFF